VLSARQVEPRLGNGAEGANERSHSAFRVISSR
jgi:hypothetical protein